jgi:hypothetical protein
MKWNKLDVTNTGLFRWQCQQCQTIAYVRHNGLPRMGCACDLRYHDSQRARLPAIGLGDRVSQALSLVGITEQRVSKLLGRPCGCSKRREALNRLGRRLRKTLP